jgi:ATP-dependent helicase/nuclease subunit B
LSVTAFRDYLACPLRFYLRHVLRMETLDDAKDGPDALDFGSMVHDALDRMGREESIRTSRDAAAISAFLADAVREWVRTQFGGTHALPVAIAMEAALQRLAALAGVQAGLAAEGWEIVQTENRFTLELDGVTVSGRIDRVDRHRESGLLRIMDYKTSDTARSPAAAHTGTVREDTPETAQVSLGGKTRRWIDLQLPLYDLLYRAATGYTGPLQLAYFNLPKAVTETGVSVWDELDGRLVSSARDCAAEVCRLVRAGVYWPPRDRVEYDDFERLFPAAVTACMTPPLAHAGEAT